MASEKMTKEGSSDINDRESRRKLKTLSIYTINLLNNDLFYYYSYSICPICRFFRLRIYVMRQVKNFTKCAICLYLFQSWVDRNQATGCDSISLMWTIADCN